MLINADFSRPAIVAADQYHWVASPQSGVERVMLDRVGAEQARATSIVRYAPDSWFPRHPHSGGEEILVLSGTFSEDDAHYPAGWYLRNPPGSNHQPSSKEGATIFVKLQQMQPQERHAVRIDTRAESSWHNENGRHICSLFSDDVEQTSLQRLELDEALFTAPVSGAELLVLSGNVLADGESYQRGSWMRLPAGQYPGIVAGSHGTTVYLKIARLGKTPIEA
ncbi:cupin domain-containing protein [Thauera sp. SDU_THAU2]|uniref:cupin domain-containing protein n=1 Tax=Thauera sp. SDU_THAU2 TaxID=3136633 RepID=UPI00311FB71E